MDLSIEFTRFQIVGFKLHFFNMKTNMGVNPNSKAMSLFVNFRWALKTFFFYMLDYIFRRTLIFEKSKNKLNAKKTSRNILEDITSNESIDAMKHQVNFVSTIYI